jgi:hypothetical protein
VDTFDDSQAVLAEDLSKFESERDDLSHALDLDGSVLFEDQLGKEESLVEAGVLANAVNVGLVELGTLGRHAECGDLLSILNSFFWNNEQEVDQQLWHVSSYSPSFQQLPQELHSLHS